MGSGVLVVNNHAADAFLAEALACLQALDFSIEMGFRENVPGEATDLVERDKRWMFDSDLSAT
ncbi:hypothetical protein Golob_009468, partial [Gossypium lobatum]|nr:hypothetical protein [Gossypium lobatum]